MGAENRVTLCDLGVLVVEVGEKALGGCSAMNAMIYIRGNRADYDSWRDRYGAAGWGYADVLPYFIRAEEHRLVR